MFVQVFLASAIGGIFFSESNFAISQREKEKCLPLIDNPPPVIEGIVRDSDAELTLQ
jgi:hypothetical protein